MSTTFSPETAPVFDAVRRGVVGSAILDISQRNKLLDSSLISIMVSLTKANSFRVGGVSLRQDIPQYTIFD